MPPQPHGSTASALIVDLDGQPPSVLEQAARMLVDEFHEPRGWPTIEKAHEEIAAVIRAPLPAAGSTSVTTGFTEAGRSGAEADGH